MCHTRVIIHNILKHENEKKENQLMTLLISQRGASIITYLNPIFLSINLNSHFIQLNQNEMIIDII